ncbi:hypothetical protein N7540_000460 [Penicillium herquei]|nr:hypothetical protein N7540_000460 [Penicillium herquei]
MSSLAPVPEEPEVDDKMLLHLPAFAVWLEDYVVSKHLGKEGVQGITAFCDRSNGEPCLLCLLMGLHATYWTEYQTISKADSGDVPEEHYSKYFIKIWNRVWNQWDKGTNNFRGQQDTTEFWPEFLGQIRNDIDPTMYDISPSSRKAFSNLFY